MVHQIKWDFQKLIVIRDLSIFGNILSSVAKKGIDIARRLRKYFLDKQYVNLIKNT